MTQGNSQVDLRSLKLRLHAEFDSWQEFLEAIIEFQKKTLIKLTVTTSKKVSVHIDDDKPTKRKRNGVINSIEEDASNGRRLRHHSHSPPSPKHRKFEYKYLKLTCKHFGSYRSTSKGIRPNQRTTKLGCPTYIYGSYDHYKDKFVIKQMDVACNHELKDEEVLLPKLLRNIADTNSENASDIVSESSNQATTPVKKKYIKKRNRNVLKVPLESPGNLILSVNSSKIRCNHDFNESCQAMSLTHEDLHSIHEQFHSKSRKEQDELILSWIEVIPLYMPVASVQVLCKLPAFDGSPIPVCWKAFSQVLRVPDKRIEDLIKNHFDDASNIIVCPSDEKVSERGDSEEIKNCVADILTSFSKESESEETPQVIYCDTVDVPQTYETTEEASLSDNICNIIETSTVKSDCQIITLPATSEASSSSLGKMSSSTIDNQFIKPPTIKVTPVDGKFCLEVECDYQVQWEFISTINEGRGLKIFFTPK